MSDYALRYLLAVTHRQTLEFFVLGLKAVSERDVDQRELFYNASILAHYAQVSTAAQVDLPAPPTLSTVFDHFVYSDLLRRDPSMMEAAGAQCLLLAGFFEDQMRRRHNIRWYSELGSGFFNRASAAEPSDARAALLKSLSMKFEPWRARQARLARELRDQPYVLPNRNSESP